MNFAYFIYAWIGVANVARSAGDYAILGGSSAGLPTPPTVAKLTALIAADVASLPNANSTNPKVSICRNVNGTAVAIIGTCSSPPQDPEVQVGTQTYTNVSVYITYTFTPLVSSFDLAGLGMPVFPATIHRRAVMRLIQ